MSPGQVVIAKRGREKGRAMVILAVENDKSEYLYLADGQTRTLSKPKKKKAMHVQPTHYFVDFQSVDSRGLQDADIRKMLGVFLGKEVSPLVKG